MKYKHFVAIIEKCNVRYVTKVDNATKQAWWKDGAKALAMSHSQAENIMFGLRFNGYKACLITMPEFEEPKNDSGKNK